MQRRLSAWARRASARWPSCNAPMVGTSPMVSPARRQLATWARRSLTLRLVTIEELMRRRSYCGRLRSGSLLRAGERRGNGAEAVLGAGKAAGAHIGGTGADGLGDAVADLGIAAHELRREVAEHADDVVDHQDLAIANRRGADADRRDRHALGDGAGHRLDGALDDEREGARLGDGLGVSNDLVGLNLVAAAGSIAAQAVHGLRHQADMAHDRDAAAGEKSDGLGHLPPALDLDRRAAGLRHDARSRPERHGG